MGIILESTSELDQKTFSPKEAIPRHFFNSGHGVTTDGLKRYQKLMQDAVKEHFRHLIKFPGFIKDSIS